MAEEELEGEEGGKKKSKLMLIIIIAVVVLGGGGAGAFFFLMGSEEPVENEETAAEASAPVPDVSEQAIYVAMPRPITFNAPGVARERLVQIEVQLMVRGLDNENIARQRIPRIEAALNQVFSTSTADELVTEIGKSELREKATAQVRQVLNGLEGTPVVEKVLFTGFVIQ